MQLQHSFSVPAGIDDAWRVLLDIERVAPCMPGAALDSVDGDAFTGSVKVKLGPIGLTYKGKASFVEKDETAHRAVIDAQGKDARGNGTAAAKVTATLHTEGTGTKVDVLTDLNITGKPAQFGRGVMADVGNKLIGQFADCLAGQLSGADSGAAGGPPGVTATATGGGAPADGVGAAQPSPAAPDSVGDVASGHGQAADAAALSAGTAASTPMRPVARRESEPIDLMASAGPAVAKRLAPVLLVLVASAAVLAILRRRR